MESSAGLEMLITKGEIKNTINSTIPGFIKVDDNHFCSLVISFLMNPILDSFAIIKQIMKKNVGYKDRILRLIMAGIFIALNLSDAIGFPENLLVWFCSVVFIITALLGDCPVYTLFGINTHTGKKEFKQYH